MIESLSLPPMRRIATGPLLVVLGAIVLLVAAAIGAQSSPALFVTCAGALIVLVAVAAARWPRTAIVLVALSPIVDRYLVADLLPDDLATASHYLSEGMLLVVSVILTWRAWTDGRLVTALRHPVTIALAAFCAVAAVSAVVNGVPPHVAALGVLFTIDAAVMFFLPRLVGFTPRQAAIAIAAVGGVVFVAALGAIGQALLHRRLFGMEPVRGRFGEEVRLASFFGDPNVLGTFLVAIIPFALLATVRLPDRRLRWLAGAVTFLLMLALWLSFSRGSWIALVVGVGVALAIVDRRALLVGILAMALSFVTAAYMPRNLLAPSQPRPNIVDSTVDRVGAIGIGGDLRTLFVLQSIPVLKDHPILGVGPGRFGGAVAFNYGTPIYDEYGFRPLFWNPAQRTVDNFWLHILVETGVLGAAAFLAATLIPGVRVLRAARAATGRGRVLLGGIAAGAAGMAIGSGTTMLLEANSIGFPFWLFLALGAMSAAALSATTPEASAPARTAPARPAG